MITYFELGWLVGLLEGEGSFRFYSPREKGGTQGIHINMTDFDTMETAAKLMQKITGKTVIIKDYRKPKNVNHQQSYVIELSGDSARKLMRAIVSHMHFRRRKRIWQCLNGFKEKKIELNLAELLPFIKQAK